MKHQANNEPGSITGTGPLQDVRILELGSLIAGPFGGRLLADLGAEVIKVEAPDAPDPMRSWGRVRYQDHPLWWPVQSRNKKCVTLNLRESRGQSLFRNLAARSDIVIENFRPGTMERWHLGYEDLARVNPGLIMVRISGFGQDGPYRDRAGFGSVGEAMGGLRYLNGFPDRPPVRMGISLGDALAALFGVIGALAALHDREKTGLGQIVDCAITESVFALMESALTEYGRTGLVRERTGNILPKIAPSNAYPTQDGKYLVMGANQDRVFGRLAEAMGQPELATDPRFATHEARGEHQEELDHLIAEWTIGQDLIPLAEHLHAHGVPAGPIYSIADIASDPHFLARGMIQMMEDPDIGPLETPGIVPKLSRTPGSLRWTGPRDPGDHNAEVYGDLLDLDAAALERLRADGII